MRKLRYYVLLIVSVTTFTGMARNEEGINLHNLGHHGNHNEYYDPADKPEVYYDADYQQIAIYADGFASYYNVDIVSVSTLQIELTTQVSGYGDTIDISSLPSDNYRIVITSSYNNVYEGLFTNY